jgi:hypothetical protein
MTSLTLCPSCGTQMRFSYMRGPDEAVTTAALACPNACAPVVKGFGMGSSREDACIRAFGDFCRQHGLHVEKRA